MVPSTRTAFPATALAAALALALIGCAGEAPRPTGDGPAAAPPTSAGPSSTAPTSTQAREDFWAGYSAIMISEVDPAMSLEDLTEKSTVVVRGRIEGVTGAREVDGRVVPAPDGSALETSLLTMRVEDVLTGEPGDTVRVWVYGAAPETAPPAESFLWYLMSSDTPDALFMTNRSGVIGPDAAGTLSTVMVPGDAEFILPDAAESLQDVQRRTEELLAG